MGHFNQFDDDPLADLLDQNQRIDDNMGVPRRGPPPNYKPAFEQPCGRCGGTGRYGRFGQCYGCKGTGKLMFKTSPEARAKAATSRATKRQQKMTDAAIWRQDHLAEVEWCHNEATRQETRMATGKHWDFPIKMRDALTEYGSLTDNQLGAVRSCMARSAERKAGWDAERAARLQAAPSVSAERIQEAFEAARDAAASDDEGIKWLKLRLDTFTFTDAPARAQWPAAILVKEGDEKLGRIVGGKFLRSRDCSDAQETRVLAAIADPEAAAVAYGQRTGECACCGRELTNKESRDRGIGPVCAEKYGW